MMEDMDIEKPLQCGVLKAVQFDILSEQDATKIAAKQIELVNEVTDPALGWPNPASKCNTCGAEDVKECEGHFGLIDLPFTIINPNIMPEVAKILNNICPGCKSARPGRIKSAISTSGQCQWGSCKYCNVKSKNYPPLKFKVSPSCMLKKTAIIAEVNEKFLRKSVLASDYWDIIPPDTQTEVYDASDESSQTPEKSNIRVLSHAQVYSILKGVDSGVIEASFKRKNSILLNCVLLTPNCHRVTEFGNGMLYDEINRHYKKLIDFRGTANDLSMRVLDCTKISKLRVERRQTTKDSASSLKYVKELLIGKRTDHAFRMVVVGDPKINLCEIGVPCDVAKSLWIGEHLNSWNLEKLYEVCHLIILQKGSISIQRNGQRVSVTAPEKLQIGDVIYRPLVDGDIVLINRPPSIHQHSLISLAVKTLPMESVLSISPLICSPLRGDFDGDCLHGYVPQSIDSRVELRELVALDKQLMDAQSGRNLLSLSHDSLTAAHLITEDGVFLSRFQMQQLQMFCTRKLQILPAIVKATTIGSSAWTGKQLIGMLLPSDFNYGFLSSGVRIRQGEVMSSSGSSWLSGADGNLFHSLASHYGGEALQFLNAAQEVLCEWLTMRGLSISLSDFYLSEDQDTRKNMLNEISCGLQEVERLSRISHLMVDSYQDFLVGCSEGVENMSIEKQKLARHSQASICAFKREFLDFQTLIYHYARNDNSLLAMLKAGSKGNLAKAVQHCMCLGLQNGSVRLSYHIPQQLSCRAWNDEKFHDHDIPNDYGPYIPCAVVRNSFLAGLNPMECFVHSLTTRESSFGGHADVSGTLTRNLMFFMRDLYTEYDATVRNAYGNHIVQFSYDKKETSVPEGSLGGHPVGSLAACAISEAAYSALDQPISAFESSPLLNLKKVLEPGRQRSSGGKTASLFLSEKLKRWTYGSEYGALGVKSHLERVLFSDIVSAVMICYSPEICRNKNSRPWVCHFHINKETAKRRRIKLQSIAHTLGQHYTAAKAKAKIELPNLQITCQDCSITNKTKDDSEFCVTAAMVGMQKKSSPDWNIFRDTLAPILLGTVVKGFAAFKKVDILWKKEVPIRSKPSKRSSGELYLRVSMAENSARTKVWSLLVDSCLPIMEMIDWDCSHPDDINDISTAYGIDVAWKSFLSGLSSAISDVGKTILPEHLVLTADCLSSTGEFVALNAKGLADQRKAYCVSAPFSQACLKSPGVSFIKAGRMESVDNLRGSAEALSWGKIPSVGTGFQFDVLYSLKGYKAAESTDVYSLLGETVSPKETNEISRKPMCQLLGTRSYSDSKEYKSSLQKSMLRAFSLDDIKRLFLSLRNILKAYRINEQLTESDKSTVLRALYFHPKREEKIGTGAHEIKVGQHDKHGSRCFVVVHPDGTSEDFSYHKCVHHALELIAPQKAKGYSSQWLERPS